MAAFALTNGRPQVVVISGNGNLYTRYVGAGGTWQSWSTLSKPSGVTSFLDVDAAYDINGVNQLYVVGNNGLAYTRRRVSSAPYAGWDSWEALTASSDGSFVRISANRDHTGVQQVYLVDVNGNVSTMREILPPGSGWSSLSGFGAIGLPDIADLDAGATEAGRQQVFAVDVNGVLWTREDVASLQAQGPNEPGAWSAWAEWDMELYAPLADPPPVVDDIVSLTADRWQEGTIPRPPVVLATDSQGNVYYTEYTSGDWQPWRSFYH
jgi:hypothetical protein